ncbi:hypothetical protein PF003_g14234 [Phytophthora fragariae]|nr:hypothetical protein PF003_g14234 [Phytophthora fragariae]
MNALCPPSPTSPWRLVVTDRFYTSVKLALELLHRHFYITGTIKTDRSGYAKDVVTAKDYKTVNKKKVMVPPQGTIKLAQNKQFPQLTAAMWMDRTPVHLLSSGGSRKTATVSKYYVPGLPVLITTTDATFYLCCSASGRGCDAPCASSGVGA